MSGHDWMYVSWLMFFAQGFVIGSIFGEKLFARKLKEGCVSGHCCNECCNRPPPMPDVEADKRLSDAC